MMSFALTVLRVLVKGIIGLLALLAIAVAIVLWIFRDGERRADLANTALERIPLRDAAFTLEGIGFSDLGSVHVEGVQLVHGDSTVARIDSLRVRGDALRFLRGGITLDEVEVVSADVRLQSLLQTFAGNAKPDSAPASPSDFRFAIRRVELRDVRIAEAAFPDSVTRRASIDVVRTLEGRLEIAGDRIEIDVDSLVATARLGPTDSLPATLVARGKWRQGAIEADTFSVATERSRVDGSGTLEMKGSAFDLRALDAAVTAAPLDAADVALVFPQVPAIGLLQLDAHVKDGAAQGTARIDADSGSVDVRRFEADLRTLPEWSAVVELGPSTWSRRSVTDARIDARSNAKTITVTAAVASKGGSLDVEGAVTDPGEDASIEVRNAEFQDLDLAVWTGAPAMTSRLNGSLRASARGTDPKTMRATGTLELAPSSFAQLEIDSAELNGTLGRGIAEVDALVHRPEGEARVHGTIEPWATPLRAQGTVLAHGVYRDVAVDSLFASVAVAGDVAQVDTLRLASAAIDAHGSGSLTWDETPEVPGDFRVHATVRDAAPLVRLAGLDSTYTLSGAVLDAHVTGAVQKAQVDATLAAEDVLVPHYFFRTVEGRASLDAEHSHADFDLVAVTDSGNVAAQGEVAWSAPGGAQEKEIRLDLASLEIPNGREQWMLAAPTTILVTGPRIDIDDARLQSGASSLRVDGTIDRRGTQDLSMEAHAFDLNSVEAFLGRRVIDGVVDGTMEVSGSAVSPRAGGDVRVVLQARDRDAAVATAKWTAENQSLRVDGRIEEPNGSALTIEGTLPLAFSLAESEDSTASFVRKTGADVDLELTGQNVTLTVLEPFLDPASVRPRAGTIDVDLRATGPLESLQGAGTLRLTDGEVELPQQRVTYEDIDVAVVLEGDRARIPELSIRSAKGTLTGSGEIAMDERRLGNTTLQLHADRFRAIEADNLKMTASGDLEMVRTVDALRVTGKLALDEMEVFLNPASLARDTRPIVLTDADRAMLIEMFGPQVSAERSTLLRDALEIAEVDVTVRADRNAWIRQRTEPRMAVELAGTVQAKKAPKGPFEFFGELRPIEGRGFVEQYGRRFELADGEVILSGDPARTNFRIESTYEVTPADDPSGTEVLVTLTLSGTPAKYDLDLSSDAGLSSSEITTLIVTGSTTGVEGNTGADRNRVAAGTAVQTGLSGVTGTVEEIAGEAIGLDVFQIRQDGLNGATLVAGKYVQPKVYAGIRQPILFDQGDLTDPSEDRDVELELEYTASRLLQLNLRGEGDEAKFFLRTKQAY